MTKEEIQAKTAEKVTKIKNFLTELQVTVTAEEVVVPNSGIITKVVYFSDNEKYEQDKEEVKENKKDVETPDTDI